MSKRNVYFAIVDPRSQREVTSANTLAQVKRDLANYSRNHAIYQITDGDRQKVHLSQTDLKRIFNGQ